MQVTEGTTLDTDRPAPDGQGQVLIAVASLLGCGALLALSTTLAKVAHGIGIGPLPFLTWSLAGATLLLSAVAFFRGQRPAINRRSIEYYVLAGFLSVAGANLIFFNAVPRVGVSFVVLTISLPPVLTYVAALLLRMETFCRWRAAGVILALCGTSVLVAGQWAAPGIDRFWIGLTLLGPVLLAAGNIYRTVRWPPGASAESLAPGMLFAATALLVTAALVIPAWSLDVSTSSTQALSLIAIQAVIFAGQFLLLFILQKAGGPVFLSLIGAVSAVIGVPLAMIVLKESLLPALLPSVALIAAGIASMVIGIRACQPVIKQKRG